MKKLANFCKNLLKNLHKFHQQIAKKYPLDSQGIPNIERRLQRRLVAVHLIRLERLSISILDYRFFLYLNL